MKWILLLVWLLFVFCLDIISLSALERQFDNYPHITYFPLTELVVPAEKIGGNLVGKVKIPCKANGKKPLKYTWRITNTQYMKEFERIDNGEIQVKLPVDKEGYMATCIVSNDYGIVFSDKRHIEVIGITSPFKTGPSAKITKFYYSFGKPLTVPCPSHDVHGPAKYSWGMYSSGAFNAYKDSIHHGITSTGSLVISYMKAGADVPKLFYCQVSIGNIQYVSHGYGLSSARSDTPYGFKLPFSPKLVEKPQSNEIAARGSEKIMRCIPTGNPVPKIVWYKDGVMIYSDKQNMKLESYNRVLVITNVSEIHEGNYQCGHEVTVFKALASTNLKVTGPPIVTKRPPATLEQDTKQDFTLKCQAKQMYSASPDPLHYLWFKDNKHIKDSSDRVIVKGNELKVVYAQSEDSGVYQCVARDSQGSSSTATRVHIKVIKCPAIPPPHPAKFKERTCHLSPSFAIGTRCTILCDRGYVGVGRKNIRRCLDNGGWSVLQYSCEDHQPPKLKEGHGCPSDVVIASDINKNTGAQVTWKPPEAEDNSGQLVTIVEPQGIVGNSHWFPVGENVVKYTFVDPSGLNTSCQFTVTVFTRTEIVDKPPSLIYVLKGHFVSLPCFARSYPIKPMYTWSKSTLQDSDQTIKITSDSHFQLMNSGEKLMIRNIDYDDSGRYECEALNIYYDLPGVRDNAVATVEVVDEVEWSPWQPWSKCDVKTCGQGMRARKRSCYKKGTRRPAVGCMGHEHDYETCYVKCTTSTTTTPPPTTQPTREAPLVKNTTVDKNTNVKILPKSGPINVLFGQYENEAREWIKQRSPWIHQWLDSVGGRVGFALTLATLCLAIVLIAWLCGRVLRIKKNISIAEDNELSDNENKEKEPNGPTQENTTKRHNQSFNENITGIVHHHENIGFLEGHNEPFNENTTGIVHHQENIGFLEGHNEPFYENTTGIAHHHDSTGFLEGHNEPFYENTTGIVHHSHDYQEYFDE